MRKEEKRSEAGGDGEGEGEGGRGFNLLDDRKDIARKRITCVYQDPAIYS